ncbi:MAG: OmpA family protein [Elusimicrobia bacterium]|nr:OmpA family protein [Elusimicrobiota bacterium]
MRRQRRDDLENQLNRGALWAVTYGDLMSYLMIFFLVLFSLSLNKENKAGRRQKYQESLANIQKVFGGPASTAGLEQELRRKREENVAQALSDTIESKELSKYVEINTTEARVRLILKEPILFDSGKAELKSAAVPVLKEIAEQIKGLPNEIVIAGFTDNVPIRAGRFTSNWELSMARAYAVIKYFQGFGISAARLSGSGYGENKAVGDNSTAEGRAKNRRITIDLIRASS